VVRGGLCEKLGVVLGLEQGNIDWKNGGTGGLSGFLAMQR